MLEFEAAAKAEPDAELATEVKMDDGEVVTFNRPTAGAYAMTAARLSGNASIPQSAAATINFFMSLLNEKDSKYFETRLFTNDLDIGDIETLINQLMEEWAGRPTK